MAYPELFERLALGTYVCFKSVLPPRVREAEVLMARGGAAQRLRVADAREDGGRC
jgi:hypothetical protein